MKGAGRGNHRENEDELPRVNGLNEPNHGSVKAIVDPENVLRDLWTKTCDATRDVNVAAIPATGSY